MSITSLTLTPAKPIATPHLSLTLNPLAFSPNPSLWKLAPVVLFPLTTLKRTLFSIFPPGSAVNIRHLRSDLSRLCSFSIFSARSEPSWSSPKPAPLHTLILLVDFFCYFTARPSKGGAAYNFNTLIRPSSRMYCFSACLLVYTM